MFEHADADFVQVFEEPVEDGHQVGRCQLVSQDNRQLVDGEGQRASHLPLNEGGRKGVQPLTLQTDLPAQKAAPDFSSSADMITMITICNVPTPADAAMSEPCD